LPATAIEVAKASAVPSLRTTGLPFFQYFGKIEATQPDVILMDIQMPVISGIEAIKLVKRNFLRIKMLMQTFLKTITKSLNPFVMEQKAAVTSSNNFEHFVCIQIRNCLLIETELSVHDGWA
jgi:CheY-like chemotaxis protein